MTDITFLTSATYLAGRPVYLVPTVPFEEKPPHGLMARGMNRGGASATYNAERTWALVVASKTLAAYYSRRSYATLVGHTKHYPIAPYITSRWFDQVPAEVA
jgi:phage terminase large subunit-like protein